MSKPSTSQSVAKQSINIRTIQIGAWSLVAATTLISLLAWGTTYQWHIMSLNPYTLFPLLGIVAFGTMWGHYIMGTIGDVLHAPADSLKSYFRYTGYAVLALICLHPGILIFQRFKDGYGLPPGSYESYVAPGLGWVTLLGTVSFLIFVAYEFGRVFGTKPWWHFVTEAGDVAMLAILYHGLRIGSDLQQGWFRFVWLFYAVTLVAVLLRSYYLKYGQPRPASNAA